jgi:branched-chain amino acid transport system substrate-binding protein
MRQCSIGLLTVAALLTVACGGDKLIVGVVLPETGPNNKYGASLKAGIKVAFDDAVAKQSPKGFEARYRDSFSTPEYAKRETGDLFKSGARIVIGGATSPEAKWMIPEAEKAKAVIISPSASEPGLAASSNLFFRVYPGDDIEGAGDAGFLVTQRKARTILVLYQEGMYAEGMLPVFTGEVTKLGAKITGKLQIGPTDWDKPISDALAAQKPDAVFICAYAEETLAALLVVRNAKFPGSVCVTSAFTIGDVIRRAGASAEGVFVALPDVDLESQKEPIKSFVQRFKAANKGVAPDYFAAYGYDAAMTALYALEGTPPQDATELLQRLMSLGSKQGVTGALSFDEVGNTTHRPRMHVIKGGKFEACDTSPRT